MHRVCYLRWWRHVISWDFKKQPKTKKQNKHTHKIWSKMWKCGHRLFGVLTEAFRARQMWLMCFTFPQSWGLFSDCQWSVRCPDWHSRVKGFPMIEHICMWTSLWSVCLIKSLVYWRGCDYFSWDGKVLFWFCGGLLWRQIQSKSLIMKSDITNSGYNEARKLIPAKILLYMNRNVSVIANSGYNKISVITNWFCYPKGR